MIPNSIDDLETYNRVISWCIGGGGLLLALLTLISILSGKKLETLKEERLAKIQLDADVKIANANSIAEISKKESEIARLNAAEANKQAADANLLAKKVEQQNIELRNKFANRRITKGQHDILVSVLSRRKAEFDIEVMSDSESGLYAADIFQCFTDSGWTVRNKHMPLGNIWIGLIVFQTDDPAMQTIIDALKQARIGYSIGNEKRDKATIMVGGKPAVF